MAESELIGLHIGLGAWIRNNFGLHGRATGRCWNRRATPNADDASMVIIEAVWRRLREDVPKVH
jgi:hypothetical protein